MVQISRIDNNLSIYRENTVVLYGSDTKSREMFNMLKINEITATYICNDGFSSKLKLPGAEYISFDKVTELCKLDNVIVQFTDESITIAKSNLPPEKVITYKEAISIIVFIDKLKDSAESPDITSMYQQYTDLQKAKTIHETKQKILQTQRNPIVLVLTPPKAGAHTLMKTFAHVGQPFHMLWHSPDFFIKDECLKKNATYKIIASVREPISRDISSLYQGLECIVASPMIDSLNLHELSPHFLTDGGDAQLVFDRVFNSTAGKDSIGEFFDLFNQHILDVLAHPFDKEKGYTIIKQGQIEVFVFQLEKMDSLAHELADWLGITIDTFLHENTADGKWTQSSYQHAKTNLKIDHDYFQKCFSYNWVNHFYSDEDIAKFKAKWQPLTQ